MRKTSIWVAAVLFGLLAFAVLWQAAPAQQKVEPVAVERYRIRRVNDTWFVLVDTATGHCWGRTAGAGQWQDMGTPAKSAR
jgi:hypothetical protein